MFFFNDTASTEIYTLSLHDALPIWCAVATVILRFFRSIDVCAAAPPLGVSVTVSCALTTASMRIVRLVGAWRCGAVVDCLGLGVTVCCGCIFATVAI